MSYPGDVFREINNRLTQLENNYSTVRMNALEEAIQLIDCHAKSDHDTWLCRRLRDMQGVREARAAIEGEPQREETLAPGQSPEYQDAWHIYEELQSRKYVHTRVLLLMNWKLGRAERVLEAPPREASMPQVTVSTGAPPAGTWAAVDNFAECAAPLPTARELQRTAGDVLREFRESGSEDWGELESAINWWAMNDFCPNFTKGDRAVSEGRLRELAAKWRKGPWHTYTESIPEAYKEGVLDCADELDAALEQK